MSPTIAPAPAVEAVLSGMCGAVEDFVRRVGGEALPLPAHFAQCASVRADGALVLRSWAWSASDFEVLRLTRIDGDGSTAIMNFAAYPAHGASVPMIQAEVLILRGRPFLVILDAECPDAALPSNLCLALEPDAEFPPAPERPTWAADVFSQRVFWSRPRGGEELRSAALARTCQFLSAAGEWCHDRRGLLASTEEALLRSRRIASGAVAMVENEPSRPYLSSQFGPGWCEEYINAFLFPSTIRGY